MYCGCARKSLDMDRILDFDCYSLGGHNILRDVTKGATGATSVAPKFSDTLTLSKPRGGGQILPTIEEVASNIFPWLRP